MNTRKKTQFMTMTALLTAIAILIPIVMPFKIVIPPASYTLGSHIAIFIAMFLSPLMAVFVILASSFGFLMAGYPMVIVFRAFSHIFFGTLGALYLQKFPDTLDKPALCQVRGMGKNHSRNLGSILLLRFFLTFTKFNIIFIFRNK